jgi:hypothetical protein
MHTHNNPRRNRHPPKPKQTPAPEPRHALPVQHIPRSQQQRLALRTLPPSLDNIQRLRHANRHHSSRRAQHESVLHGFGGVADKIAVLLREEVVRAHLHRSCASIFARRADQTAVDSSHSFGAENLLDGVASGSEAFCAIGVVDHCGFYPLAWSRDRDAFDYPSGDSGDCIIPIPRFPIAVFESMHRPIEDKVANADFQR